MFFIHQFCSISFDQQEEEKVQTSNLPIVKISKSKILSKLDCTDRNLKQNFSHVLHVCFVSAVVLARPTTLGIVHLPRHTHTHTFGKQFQIDWGWREVLSVVLHTRNTHKKKYFSLQLNQCKWVCLIVLSSVFVPGTHTRKTAQYFRTIHLYTQIITGCCCFEERERQTCSMTVLIINPLQQQQHSPEKKSQKAFFWVRIFISENKFSNFKTSIAAQ